MFMKKASDGNWYVSRRSTGGQQSKKGKNTFRNWFLGKKSLHINHLIIPQEFWGKHLRFKMEIINENET